MSTGVIASRRRLRLALALCVPPLAVFAAIAALLSVMTFTGGPAPCGVLVAMGLVAGPAAAAAWVLAEHLRARAGAAALAVALAGGAAALAAALQPTWAPAVLEGGVDAGLLRLADLPRLARVFLPGLALAIAVALHGAASGSGPRTPLVLGSFLVAAATGLSCAGLVGDGPEAWKTIVWGWCGMGGLLSACLGTLLAALHDVALRRADVRYTPRASDP
jgi:hypothetical protein